MSITKQLLFQIECDINECYPPAENSLDQTDGVKGIRAAKKYWHKKGWRQIQGKDCCPECYRKHEEKDNG